MLDFVKTTGKYQVAYMPGVNRTTLDLILIVGVIPVLIFFQFVLKNTVNEIVDTIIRLLNSKSC